MSEQKLDKNRGVLNCFHKFLIGALDWMAAGKMNPDEYTKAHDMLFEIDCMFVDCNAIDRDATTTEDILPQKK